MRKRRLLLLLLNALILSLGIVCAQDDERKWALEYTGSVLLNPVLTSNPSGLSTGRGFSGLHVKGELFLPDKWHLQAGYFRTEVSYGDGDRTMEGLQVGIKKYFLRPKFALQPFLLAAGQMNWSEHTEYTNVVAQNGYARMQQTTNPRISFLPGAGIDMYLFSSVALVMEYTFNMGINSHTSLEVSPADAPPYVMADKGMFHNLSLGVKVAFPFTVTSADGQSLFLMLWNALFQGLYY